MTAHTPETYGCRYCFGIGACPKCWGRAGYDRLKAINADLLAALETMTAWVEKWQRDGKLGAGALLAMANHVDEARAALTKVRV